MQLTTALLQPKNHNQFHSGNCMALTTCICFWLNRLPKNSMFYGTASLIRNLRLEIPADEKARSGLVLLVEIAES